MDGDINERLIKRNNIDDDGTTLDGTGGVRDAFPFFFFWRNTSFPVKLCIFVFTFCKLIVVVSFLLGPNVVY